MRAVLAWVVLFWCAASELSHYPHYPHRKTADLGGNWDFAFQTDWNLNQTDTSGVQFNRSQAVPAAWDAAWGTGLQYTRGTGFYRKTLSITPNTAALLHFEACSMWCRVIVDSVVLAEVSDGGFTQVSLPSVKTKQPSLTSAFCAVLGQPSAECEG